MHDTGEKQNFIRAKSLIQPIEVKHKWKLAKRANHDADTNQRCANALLFLYTAWNVRKSRA